MGISRMMDATMPRPRPRLRLGGMHASAVVMVARDKLVIALRDSAATLPENLRRHLEELKGKMETMAEVMGDAEMRSIREEAVREWLMRLEDAAYGIWDMVDDLQLQSNKGAPVTARGPPCLPIAIAREGSTATTMSKTIQNLDSLLMDLERFGFRRVENTGKLEQSVHDAHHPGTASFVDEEYCIVGRDDEKYWMTSWILSAARDSNGGLFILAIVGLGGIGKTTLAKMVFCDTTITRDYARAWVHVGPEFDLKKIGNCILSQLSNKGEHQDSSNVDLIVKRLDKLLGGGNKVLVVLDDLWSDNFMLGDLKRMLGAEKKDGEVIVMVTTRSFSVANTLGDCGIFEVSALSDWDSLQLLQLKLGFATGNDDDARARWDLLHLILKKCRGIPLAIHALGDTLRFKTPEEIISVIDNDIWADDQLKSLMSSLLWVSYQFMPRNLRLCFDYCAIFPRGHSIPKDDLVHHWTALQLIEPSDKLSATQLANKYIGMLLGMSFLQPSMPPSLRHQLRYLNLSGSARLVNLPDSFGNLLNLEHIDLSGCSGLLELPASFGNLTNVVHIDLSGCVGLKTLPPESFGLLKRLEHLDLSSCSCLEGIPDFVNGLTNLQHLNLSHPCCYLAKHRFHLKALKDIWVELINLRYLNLSMCLNPMLCYLPEKERIEYIESISCLHKLEHLDLSHNIFLSDIPESLGQLGELQTLNLSGCIRLKRIDKWMGERNCPKKFLVVSNCLGLERYQFVVCTDGEGKISNLAQLKDVSCKEVEISRLENVISAEEAQSIGLTGKKKVQKLTLVWSAGRDDVSSKDQALLEELVPPQNLQCFELHGYSSEYLPAWLASNMLSHLPNLMEVTMVDIPSCSNLPPFGVLPNLQRLILKRVAKVT